MPIVNAEILKSLIPVQSRLLALDISRNAIGLACVDLSRNIATPLQSLKRARLKEDAKKILLEINALEAKALIVGLPLNMDGTEGARCQAVKDTTIELMKHFPSLPIVFHDERLTTKDAYSIVEDLGDKHRKRLGKTVDHYAAMLIAESFMDQLEFN